MNIEEIIGNVYTIPEESVNRLKMMMEPVSYKKHDLIIDTAKIDRNVYFIQKGVTRAYVIDDGREITFWIGEEGALLVSMEGYINSRCGYEFIEAVEDTTLYRIRYDLLERLYNEDIHIANWGRKLAEKEILRAEKSLIPQLYTTARRRYEELLKSNPGLINRIPLEHLASFIGVTPVSLSRIRAEIGKH